MWYKLHFTEESMAEMERLGLNQDDVRRVIDAGSKMQAGENILNCRHRGVEVQVETLGPDYGVMGIRGDAEWPRGKPRLAYLDKPGGSA